VLTTPLQVAASYMAVANGGTLYRPHLGKQVVAPNGEVVRQIEPEVLAELGLDSAEMNAIRTGCAA
jgi:penicillin-binding protein 2